MISNQVLQNTIEGIKSITRIDICVMDTEGKMLASTVQNADEFEKASQTFVDSPADSQALQGSQFFKVYDEQQLEYVLIVKGDSDDVYMIGKMITFQLQSLIVAYKERYDKDNFIKNLLLDNLLLVDIYNRAKKLHIDTDVRRVVFIVETSTEKDNFALETVRTLFASTKSKDFITAVDEKNIIIVKELRGSDTYDDMEKVGKVVLDMLNTEAMSKVRVAYGTVVNESGCYVWYRANRDLRNQIMDLSLDGDKETENQLSACLRMICDYEGAVQNTAYLLSKGKTTLAALEESLQGNDVLDLTGCSLDSILYYVNRDIPVLALTNTDDTYLIIGFNQLSVVVYNPITGTNKIGRNEAEELFGESGNRFIAYAPNAQ